MIDAYKSMFPKGMDIDGIMNGKFNANKIFDDAVRQAEAIMADGQTRPAPGVLTRKG